MRARQLRLTPAPAPPRRDWPPARLRNTSDPGTRATGLVRVPSQLQNKDQCLPRHSRALVCPRQSGAGGQGAWTFPRSRSHTAGMSRGPPCTGAHTQHTRCTHTTHRAHTSHIHAGYTHIHGTHDMHTGHTLHTHHTQGTHTAQIRHTHIGHTRHIQVTYTYTQHMAHTQTTHTGHLKDQQHETCCTPSPPTTEAPEFAVGAAWAVALRPYH